MTKIKPILFNTDMVRAILDGRKTATRRVIKLQHLRVLESPYHKEHPETPDKVLLERLCIPPYRSGDSLYVRETWNSITFGNGNTVPFRTEYWYKADDTTNNPDDKWRPSIHMPREAARIFLRVTNVSVAKLQDMSHEDAEQEGCWCGEGGLAMPLDKFADLWDSTLKPADRALYGWEANPWVWIIEFERISKEEAGV